MDIDAVVPFIFPIGVVVVLAVIYFQKRKSQANLIALAEKLGLQIDARAKESRMLGERRGRSIEVFSYTEGMGKNKQSWVAIAARVKDVGRLSLAINPRMSLFDVFLRFFRKGETKFGDRDFDKKWVVTTNRPDFIRIAILPEMREKIMRLGGSAFTSGHFKLDIYSMQYAELGSFSSARLCTRFAELADVVCDLADAAEVGEELKKAQS